MKGFDIIHQLHINASSQAVFDGISTTEGLNQWWSKNSQGRPEMGSIYELDFENVVWQAQVTQMVSLQEFELIMTRCDDDWMDTIVRFELKPNEQGVDLKFSHLGWPQANDHYYISNHCWGLYLRVLRRFLEYGEEVPYEQRLKV